MQMCDSPEQLTAMINDIFSDGIDNLDPASKKMLQKFQRITAFCEAE
jgi:hypothetical protein